MRRFFSFFLLAGVLAIVATSCYKDDIENLQKQIDALKSGEIATIETQISSINTSITELKSVDNTLKEYITALQSDSKKYAQQIADLTAMDKTLETKIADLQKHVDSGIKDTKDWASATFATLDQMDSVATVVAKVVAGVKQISTDLDSLKKEVTGGYTKAIEAATTKLEASMKKWVSEQLADYYSIAKLNAVLDSLGKKQSKIDSSMFEKIQAQKIALDTAKSQITAAYKAAIKIAIDSLQGKFNTKLANEIATAKNALQTQIDTITLEISSIKSRLSQAETNIAALLAQIQSISVIPTFSDGSVVIGGEVDTISFDIHPTAMADSIVKVWKASDSTTRANMISFKVLEVQTKGAASPAATVDTAFLKDNEFKVGVKFQNLPANAMVSLHLAYGNTDVSSSYFLLSYTIPDGALTGVFSVSAATKVRFSKGNLRYVVGTPGTWGFYEHQYDCASSYESSVVSLFTWGCGAWSTEPATTSCETGNSMIDWGTKIDSKGTWRTLTGDEWTYLIGTSAERQGKTVYPATVAGISNCLVIAPDDYAGAISSSFTAEQWASAEASGLVCLSPAGFRMGSNTVSTIGSYGDYWSSSAIDADYAESLQFSFGPNPVTDNRERNRGCSVRLVTVVLQ